MCTKDLRGRLALLGTTMRNLILEALEAIEECRRRDHVPNKETIKTLHNVNKGKNLVKVKDLADLFKKLNL